MASKGLSNWQATCFPSNSGAKVSNLSLRRVVVAPKPLSSLVDDYVATVQAPLPSSHPDGSPPRYPRQWRRGGHQTHPPVIRVAVSTLPRPFHLGGFREFRMVSHETVEFGVDVRVAVVVLFFPSDGRRRLA